MSASHLYMPKVGGRSTTVSPGSTNARASRSITSSAPAPQMMCSIGTPTNAATAWRSAVWSGSG